MRRRAALAVSCLLLTGCGQGTGSGGVATVDDRRYEFTGTVLESPDHGPQLCHIVATSLPPQCGGPDVVGWDWSGLDAESRNGTTWGRFTVVGTWDGERLTPTGPPVPPAEPSAESRPPSSDFSSPCPEPDGGWVAPDPDRATHEAQEEALAVAAATEGFAGAWIDQAAPDGVLDETTANDPRRLVLNLTTAGDVEALEGAVREVWGGALCVSGARYSEADLRAAQRELDSTGDYTLSGVSVRDNEVHVTAWAATDELQAELDERFGAGIVRVDPLLRRVDD